ncbi:CHAT domain-containing protein [Mycobacterium asiaticum]|uniref:CHAT domain-containing protein n=1 Tax=Mycobacterium asiaticum TaxID=1790 RepID=A0A1A3NJW5_MYCAS|nr:CHAT domain-containing protein [Mycobacterium asiaticum]OBK20652.1 CHAT domain-containing protein [Mycobacterium asiaticum]
MRDPGRLTLVLRYADLGIATYASLRIVGRPSQTVNWVVEDPILLAALEELTEALPEPHGDESRRDAIERALTRGPFASPDTELTVAYILGVLLIGAAGWQLLAECVAQSSERRPALFISPSARLARVPWGLLALPKSGPSKEELVRARQDAITSSGRVAARIPWQLTDVKEHTDGYRLMELVDVLLAVPQNIVHAPRTPAGWEARRDGAPVLILDPRVPGQRPDSPLGSVLGRPSAHTPLAEHFAELMRHRPVLPHVESSVELFRRQDTDRFWLADMLAQSPSRLLYVGHASSADGEGGGDAARAALHLACTAAAAGEAGEAGGDIGNHRPLTASDLMSLRLPMPPRVALLACASGGDYRFDEAAGLVAAMILGGAQLVTATLWSLPTTAAYRQFSNRGEGFPDPMADVVIAVDEGHRDTEAAYAVNRWQRAQLRSWRDGTVTASPLYWGAMVTFAVDGAR